MENSKIAQTIKSYKNEFDVIVVTNVSFDKYYIQADIRYQAYHKDCYRTIGQITTNIAKMGLFPVRFFDYGNNFRYVYEDT